MLFARRLPISGRMGTASSKSKNSRKPTSLRAPTPGRHRHPLRRLCGSGHEVQPLRPGRNIAPALCPDRPEQAIPDHDSPRRGVRRCLRSSLQRRTHLGADDQIPGCPRTAGQGTHEQAGFRGTFRELPFVDLMQALGLSQRSCEVRLGGNNGDRAKIYCVTGR